MVVAYREGMIDESKIAERFAGLGAELNERQRRLWAATEARSFGRGGIAAVVRATVTPVALIGSSGSAIAACRVDLVTEEPSPLSGHGSINALWQGVW